MLLSQLLQLLTIDSQTYFGNDKRVIITIDGVDHDIKNVTFRHDDIIGDNLSITTQKLDI